MVRSQYTTGGNGAAVQIATFGLYAPRWMRSDYRISRAPAGSTHGPSTPRMEAELPQSRVSPDGSRGRLLGRQTGGRLHRRRDPRDREAGEYSDPRAAEWIAECLIKRRDKIAQAWFSRVLPVDKFRVTEGRLEFDDLGPKRAYDIQWSDFDNDRQVLTGLNNTTGPQIPSGGATDYLAAKIGCGADAGDCPPPVTVYLHRSGAYYEIVGVDR